MGKIRLGALTFHFPLLLYPLVLSQTKKKKGISQEIKEGVHQSVCATRHNQDCFGVQGHEMP